MTSFFEIKVYVFLENDIMDLRQFFSRVKTLVYYNLHWKAMHPAFKAVHTLTFECNEPSKASFLLRFIVCSVKHINALCIVAMVVTACCSCIAIFAVLSFTMLKCERVLSHTKLYFVKYQIRNNYWNRKHVLIIVNLVQKLANFLVQIYDTGNIRNASKLVNRECRSESWKRLNLCGSGSTLKKEAGSGSKKYSTASASLLQTPF